MTFKQPQNLLLQVFPNKTTAFVSEVFLLLLAGAFAGLVHQILKVPLQLPGKQGLFFMLVITSSTYLSRFKMSATLTTVGAATFLFLFPGASPDPVKPLLIILTGSALDFLLLKAKNTTISIFLLSIAGGICWSLIPIVRIVITMTTGMPFKSFLLGFAYPVATHFLFGCIGALIAAVVFKKIRS